jgi:hypothetical protein
MKSVFLRLGILLLLLLLGFGCSSINKLIQDGIGQPISMTIDRWGPPSRVTPDGRGGSIYVWERWEGGDYGIRRFWSAMFWVDSKGIIYKWR